MNSPRSLRPGEKIVQKVVVCLLRKKESTLEILVFDHLRHMEVSPQMPSGSVEAGENVVEAAKRELFEESGLVTSSEFKFLGSYQFYKSYNDQFQERHVFAVVDSQVPEEWTHTVSGSGDDEGLKFRYRWMSVSEAKEKLQANLGDVLSIYAQEISNLFSEKSDK